MPTLDPNSWTQRDRDDLDRYITGNWGEDQYTECDDEGDESTKVYIDHTDPTDLCLRHAYTGERMSDRPETLAHNLIELANANGWEIVDGPLTSTEEDDEVVEDWPDDDPGFDPMFLM